MTLAVVAAFGRERSDSLATPWAATLSGVPMLAVGSVTAAGEHHFRSTIGPIAAHSNSTIDNIAPYSTLALTGILKLSGVETRSSWGRLAVSSAFSGVFMAGLGQGFKHVINERRPDSTGDDAFPSGHTTMAFTCAAIMSRELGWRSPWYSIGAYTAAGAIGVSRVMRGRHWAGDVVFGAGLGITSTNLGYLLADLIYGDRGLAEGYTAARGALLPEKPSFLGVGMELTTGRRLRLPAALRPLRLDAGAAVATAVEGAWFFNRHWGVGGRFRVSSAPLGVAGDDMSGKPLDAVGADCAVWFGQPLPSGWSFTAKAFAGVNHCFAAELGSGRLTVESSTSPAVGAGIGVIKAVRGSSALRFGVEYGYSPEKLTFTDADGSASATTPFHNLTVSLGIVSLF